MVMVVVVLVLMVLVVIRPGVPVVGARSVMLASSTCSVPSGLVCRRTALCPMHSCWRIYHCAWSAATSAAATAAAATTAACGGAARGRAANARSNSSSTTSSSGGRQHASQVAVDDANLPAAVPLIHADECAAARLRAHEPHRCTERYCDGGC